MLLGFVDQSGVRSEVLLEAYAPKVSNSQPKWQAISIPLADFPNLGRHYNQQGKLSWRDVSWQHIEKLTLHTISIPMDFKIGNFRMVKHQ